MEEKNSTKRFKVYVSKRTNNETNEEFNAYKALTKQGKIDLRFTKDVKEEDRPTKTCYLLVSEENVNVNQKFEYPIMWVSKIDEIEEIEFNQNINDYLD